MADQIWVCSTCGTPQHSEELANGCEKVHIRMSDVKIRGIKFGQRRAYSSPTGAETYYPTEIHIYKEPERPWEGYFVYEQTRYVSPV